MTQGPAESDPEESQWRFSVDEVGPEAEPDPPEPDPIEPESITFEHAVFVGLGVALTVGIILTGLL
ncbi:DUF7312 domain-containing protein [Halohasta litorea]|uniref:DUF7312 domain-containing protein n=1 Tax=Halohasta litorea TaxID=869891 RepID=A0ABD6D7A9_9EURY|nr:hypothetical protein [Halohasta litorea]